ncbi:MFS transporter [Desulfosporosinus sp. PR]|uniref:MFS transporter n=1 Tax=Candidatus Desulfosporosinus nitrosoreducens TaxID=3401928 RepID=UPI0027E81AD1|nr:MFS transporter [Desulfosporosinus sp. PR]MDQ7092579.1 MFS transporter [Desulfosporosinus sp. PR]
MFLQRNRSFSLLWFGQTVSQLGDAFFNLAILVKAFNISGSAVLVGRIMTFAIIPQILIGFFIGPWIDRFNKKKVLIVVDVIRAFIVIVVPLANSTEILQILLFVLSGFATIFNPTIIALLPDIVKGEQLTEGNAINSTTQSSIALIGPALGGVIIATLGLDISFYFDGLSYLLSAFCVLLLKVKSNKSQRTVEKGFIDDWLAGLRYVRNSSLVRSIIIAFVFYIFVGTSIDILLVFLVRDTLKLSTVWLGIVDSAWALGMLGGGPLMLFLRQKISPLDSILLGLAGAGFMMFLLSLAPSISLVIPVMVIMGLGNTFAAVASTTVLQMSIPEELRGRVFAFRSTLIQGAAAMSMTVGGLLAGKIGVRKTIMGAGCSELLWIICWLFLRYYGYRSKLSIDLEDH